MFSSANGQALLTLRAIARKTYVSTGNPEPFLFAYSGLELICGWALKLKHPAAAKTHQVVMLISWSRFIIPAAAKLMLLNQGHLLEQLQITINRGQADAGQFLPSLLLNLIGTRMPVRMPEDFPY